MARKPRLSVITLADQVPDEASAYRFLENMRWPEGPVCPHCGGEKAYFLNPENGRTRKTTRGAESARRVWKCASCKKQFSVLTGTVMHGTKIAVRKWVLVIFEMIASKNGVSAREIERKYDVTAESAWFMTMRIREAMKLEPLASVLSGTIVADETWIGGKPANKHASKRHARDHYGPREDKIPVLSLIDSATGEVRSQVVPDVRGHNLRRAIERHVDLPNTTLHTDSATAYVKIGWDAAGHESVSHVQGEYVRDGVSTNKAENFFSQLKRSLDGTHHHISGTHLPRYLSEFDYRYTTRTLDDTARMEHLIGRVGGRRLTYRPVAR